MPAPPKDVRNIASKIRAWADGHKLLNLARKLCREYVRENSGKSGLNDFDAKDVKVQFERQVLVFPSGRSSQPYVETALSLEVFNGATSIGTYKLNSKLNGQTSFTSIDLDCSIMPGLYGAAVRIKDVRFSKETFSVDFHDGRTITIPYSWYHSLLHASPKKRLNWEIWGTEDGISWPDLDEHIGTNELFRGTAPPS